jgi:hypothetical protein
MSFNKLGELKKKYDELLDLVISATNNDKLEVFKQSYSDDNLESIILKFCNTLESDKKVFKLFIKRNSRIFGNKIKLRIIPSIHLKSLLNKDKGYIWECIQLLYAIYRTGDDKYKKNVQNIVESIEKCNLGENESESSISTENDESELDDDKPKSNVDNMVLEIADTLRDNMVSASKGSQKVNPIENMIKTSQMISEKYGTKLKNGEISMNDMFASLGRMMGEIDKKTSNDDELKKVEIDDIPNPEDMMSQLGIDTKGFNPMDMVSQLLNQKKEKSELTPEQLKEMEEFYANVSTEDLMIENLKGNDSVDNKLEKINENLMNKLPDNKKNELHNITKTLMASFAK